MPQKTARYTRSHADHHRYLSRRQYRRPRPLAAWDLAESWQYLFNKRFNLAVGNVSSQLDRGLFGWRLHHRISSTAKPRPRLATCLGHGLFRRTHYFFELFSRSRWHVKSRPLHLSFTDRRIALVWFNRLNYYWHEVSCICYKLSLR